MHPLMRPPFTGRTGKLPQAYPFRTLASFWVRTLVYFSTGQITQKSEGTGMKQNRAGKKGVLTALVLLLVVTAGENLCAEPLALDDAVTRALANSPEVAAAEKGLKGAEAREEKSLSALMPRVDFEESYLRSDQPVAVFGSKLNQRQFTTEDFAIDRLNNPDSTDNWRTKFTVTQPLFRGGQLHQNRTIRQLERKASEWDVEGTKAHVGFRTIEAYWGLSLAREREKVAEMALKTSEESLRQIELLYEEGSVVRSDLLSAKVQKAGFHDQLVKARGRTRVAERALEILIGESEDRAWEVVTLCPPGPEQIPDLNTEELLNVAKENRPEFVGLKVRWHSTGAAVKAAQGNFLPTLGLEASYEWNSENFASDQEGSYLLGLGIQWNLFRGLADKADLKEAKSGQEMLRQELRGLEDMLTLEIEEAVVAVTTGRESLIVTRERVSQAEESLRIIRKRYGEGLTNVVELEQAELVVSNSRLEWLRAVYGLRIALARLKLVTGELVQSLPALSCGPRESAPNP
jgi:outer membrane protein